MLPLLLPAHPLASPPPPPIPLCQAEPRASLTYGLLQLRKTRNVYSYLARPSDLALPNSLPFSIRVRAPLCACACVGVGSLVCRFRLCCPCKFVLDFLRRSIERFCLTPDSAPRTF